MLGVINAYHKVGFIAKLYLCVQATLSVRLLLIQSGTTENGVGEIMNSI